MPDKPMKYCRRSGCPQLVRSPDVYCKAHQRYNTRRNKRADLFYKRGAWARCRKQFLRRHPLCAMCKRIASVVDHIIPRAEGGADYDPENLQSLCVSCHSKKSLKDRRKYNEAV